MLIKQSIRVTTTLFVVEADKACGNYTFGSAEMNKNVVVPVDGSSNALRALDVAVDLARQRQLGIILVHVVPQGGIPEGLRQWASIEHVHEEPQWLYEDGLGRNVLNVAAQNIPATAGIEVKQLVQSGDVAKNITDMSKTADVAMIVMGSRGLSDFGGLVLGSIAHRVAHSAACSVVTVS